MTKYYRWMSIAMVALLLGALATTTVAARGGANRDDTAGSRRDRRDGTMDDRTRLDGTGGPGGMTVEQGLIGRSTNDATLTGAGPAPPVQTYAFSGSHAVGDSEIYSALSGMSDGNGWTINTPPTADVVQFSRVYVSGPSTIVAARNVTSLAWSGSQLTVNTNTFTFGSAADANFMGTAIALARALSTDTTVTLTNVSATKTLGLALAKAHQ